jgi:hypothetical protein
MTCKLPPTIDSCVTICEVSGCWLWQGELNRNGYGRVWVSGRRLMVHRVVYALLVGEIPKGLVLDHKSDVCSHRNCCNPAHLEPVTVKVNTHRGRAVLFKRAEK